MRVPRCALAWLTLAILTNGPAVARPPFALPAPETPAALRSDDRVVSAELESAPFDKFLKYKTFRVALSHGQTYQGGFVYGPGHHSSAMAAIVLNPEGIPYAVFKSGDTRLGRATRNQPYVATSGIAGRWDHEGHSAGDIVLGELSEEVGGQVVEGTFRRLGDQLSPTMPFESTECDDYFMAAVEITRDPYGDGGLMEAVGLIGPSFYSPSAAIAAMDSRQIFDAGRARTMLGRAWDSIGYLPQLGVYIQDYPELKGRFSTLGLSEPWDIREKARGGPIPAPRAHHDDPKSRISTVFVDKASNTELGSGARMVDARIRHAYYRNNPSFFASPSLERLCEQATGEWRSPPDANLVALDPDFASQFLQLDYDRAKVVVYYNSVHGPMVEMVPQARPALAFAPGSPLVVRRDIRDLPVPKAQRDGEAIQGQAPMQGAFSDPSVGALKEALPGELRVLAQANGASSGQSDLFYHYLSCRLDGPPDQGNEHFLPLAQAIQLCREGHGDSQTEATLLRLADAEGWIPQLGMSQSHARALSHPSPESSSR